MKNIFIIGIICIGMIPIVFGDVYIQNDQQYIGEDNSFHIVGEIVNNLESPINQINVKINMFDDENNIIHKSETNSLVNIIMPEMKGPFELILSNHETDKIKSYSLELFYEISLPKNQVIEITDSKLSKDNHNNLMISGTVANNGDITANTVTVIATMYDKKGNVVAVSKVNPEPDYLRAEDNTFFLIPILDKSKNNEIIRYSIVAESEEYAAVPEFPISTLILLVATLSTYIGITKFSGKIITNLFSATNLK